MITFTELQEGVYINIFKAIFLDTLDLVSPMLFAEQLVDLA